MSATRETSIATQASREMMSHVLERSKFGADLAVELDDPVGVGTTPGRLS